MKTQDFYKNRRILLILLALTSTFGCKKYVDTKPPSDKINSLNVFSQNATAISAVTEMYGKLVSTTGNSTLNITLIAGLSADEYTLFNGVTQATLVPTYKNDLKANSTVNVGGQIWTMLYQGVLSANTSLEGLTASTELYPSVRKQLLGECYFMRAFYYFYLVNLYGDVPLALTSDPNINNSLPRTTVDRVYEQIVEDLLKAREYLNVNYVNKDLLEYTINPERIRPNRAAATALLARVYLFKGNDYLNAETLATEVINQTNLYGLLPITDVFLKNSKEAIWQLQPVLTGRNTNNGFMFILPSTGPNSTIGSNGNPVSLSATLLSSFEGGDARVALGSWINKITTSAGVVYYYPYKYKVKAASTLSEYEMVLRLSEQYLIRAEARAMQGKLTGQNSAMSDLNVIRTRAGLQTPLLGNLPDVLNLILKERRSELFAEWGHRWLDLKRLRKIDEVMSTAVVDKGGTWRSYQQLYPISFSDIQKGPNLIQNLGY